MSNYSFALGKCEGHFERMRFPDQSYDAFNVCRAAAEAAYREKYDVEEPITRALRTKADAAELTDFFQRFLGAYQYIMGQKDRLE